MTNNLLIETKHELALLRQEEMIIHDQIEQIQNELKVITTLPEIFVGRHFSGLFSFLSPS